MRRELSEGGFTVIELMMVVLIATTLASVVVPRFADSITKSQAEACSATRTVAEQADERYAADNEGEYTSLTGLVEADYVEKEPKCTSGGIFAWLTLESGVRVVACSLHGWHYSDSDDSPVEQPPVEEPPAEEEEEPEEVVEEPPEEEEKGKEVGKERDRGFMDRIRDFFRRRGRR